MPVDAETLKSPDREFESLRLCFYPDKDDFHMGGLDAAPPGEDIWKKFELQPTPPLSPSRAGSGIRPGGLLSPDGWPGGGEPPDWAAGGSPPPPPESEPWPSEGPAHDEWASGGNLRAFVLRDCMWSGVSVREKLDWVATESPHPGLLGALAHAPPAASAHCAASSSEPPSRPADLGAAASGQFVDPAAVFCPLSERGSEPPAAASTATPEGAEQHPRRPGAYGAHGRQRGVDDDDDNDDYDDDDDGAACDRPPDSARGGSLGWLADVLQQHNYAARPPSEEDDAAPPQQRPKAAEPARRPSSLPPRAPPRTPKAKDSERRRQHNFQQRQRRRDLRASFLTLRDHVPELLQSCKVSKVVILRKAAEYVRALRAEEHRLHAEKRKLLGAREQLLQKVGQRRTC